jgi:hypothetical protein
MTAEQIRRIGKDYVRHVRATATSAGRIVDKALGNFVFVGLIHLALPNARVIHACCNAVDTCLSCYSKLFISELLYTYDFGELGRYYRSYGALMQHWRSVLPHGAMLDVQYEELVADFEAQARSIVAYLSDDRCLSFHKTQRPVRTASTAQVRRPSRCSASYESGCALSHAAANLFGVRQTAGAAIALGQRQRGGQRSRFIRHLALY